MNNRATPTPKSVGQSTNQNEDGASESKVPRFPQVCIPLTPVPKASPYHATAGLDFNCRTDVPLNAPSVAGSTKSSMESDTTLTDQVSSPTVHSYPPTPTASSSVPSSPILPPPSWTETGALVGSVSRGYLRSPSMAPHSHNHVPQPDRPTNLLGSCAVHIQALCPVTFFIAQIKALQDASGIRVFQN